MNGRNTPMWLILFISCEGHRCKRPPPSLPLFHDSVQSVTFHAQPWPPNNPHTYLTPSTARECQRRVDTRCPNTFDLKTYQVCTKKHLHCLVCILYFDRDFQSKLAARSTENSLIKKSMHI